MEKLSIISDSIENESPGKLKINVSGKKIYYTTENNEVITITEGSLEYRPLHCSELYNRLDARNWNKSETLFVSGVQEDNPILRYRKYTTPENKPTGEIDEIDVENNNPDLSFPLCGILSTQTKAAITEAYEEIFDTTRGAHEEVCFLGSSKSIMETSEGAQESIDLVKGFDSYTTVLDLHDLIEYSNYPRTSGRVDLSVKYSMITPDKTEAKIYNYFTTFKAFEYNESREVEIENLTEIIGDNLIRIEYLGGTIRLFPMSPSITECIISDCTIVYGKFR